MNRDLIVLKVPGKPNYISTIRLTTSSIANKLDFDVESIEDIRVAISEACNIVMNGEEIQIEYVIGENSLSMRVIALDREIKYSCDESEKMGVQILSMLVDEVEFTENEIRFKKTVGEI